MPKTTDQVRRGEGTLARELGPENTEGVKDLRLWPPWVVKVLEWSDPYHQLICPTRELCKS